MKICVAGKNSIAVNGMKYVTSKYKDIELFVCVDAADEGRNAWQPSFLKYARESGLKVVTVDQLYDVPDLVFFSLEYHKLVNPDLFASDRLYNIHFSLLPAYKGMFTSAWPILNGELETGVTFHRIDRGIDTGDIVAQSKFKIGASDTCRDLYFKYLNCGTNLFIETVDRVIHGDYSVVPQSPHGSTYYSKRSIDYSNLCIDLNQTAENISRQVRAFSFREYQFPSAHGVNVSNVHITKNKSKSRPGTILERDARCITISTVDYDVRLTIEYFPELIKYSKLGNCERIMEISSLLSDINATDRNGWTALMIASYYGHYSVCEQLLQCGADPCLGNMNGTTPLMYARHSPSEVRLQIMECLLRFGANVKQVDVAGNDISYYAKKNGERDVVEFITNIKSDKS